MSLTYTTVQTEFEDSASLDSFARLRTSSPATLFDSKLVNSKQPLFWDEQLTGSGTSTHLPNEAAIELQVTTTSGDKVLRRTKEYFTYQPGKGHTILMTGVLGVLKTNVRQRIGYFDDSNGLFFEQDGTDLKVVLRSSTSGSPVDTAVTQANWNLDTLDGNGESQINLDSTKTQIFFVDFEWLGVGRVRMGVMINGKPVYCHQFKNANISTEVYMTTPNLPCSYEIENTGTSASNTVMKQICTTVISEGGFNAKGVIRSINMGDTPVNITSRRAILSVRLKSANVRNTIVPLGVNVLATTANDNILWEVIVGGTLGGSPSWTSVSANSIAEYDLAGTTVTGGELIASGYTSGAASTAQSLESALNVVADIAGNRDIISIVITNTTAGAGVLASLTWKDLL